MNCSYIMPADVQNSINKVHENRSLMFGRGKTWKLSKKLIVLSCLHSPPCLFWRKIGTQSHSAKFLNWSDHVNSVPDLAASPSRKTSRDWLEKQWINKVNSRNKPENKLTSCLACKVSLSEYVALRTTFLPASHWIIFRIILPDLEKIEWWFDLLSLYSILQ